MSAEYSAMHVDRVIPRISLRDFDTRMDEITAELVAAAENYGFFVLTDHAVSQSAIDAQFAAARGFFDLAEAVKEKTPFAMSVNAGWEKNSQGPSTGGVDCNDRNDHTDRKESYHMSSDEHMAGRWVADDDLPGFRTQSLAFMHACHSLSTKLLVCLARGLGLEDDQAFLGAHDITKPCIQTVLCALHYFTLGPAATAATAAVTLAPTPTPAQDDRAGPHDDWSFLTLLFQRPGQSGLAICPGRDAINDLGHSKGAAWTRIKPVAGEIVCNIGDLLMAWSDDRFKSTLHRVQAPTGPAVDDYGDRYSLAFSNQPSSERVVQGPKQLIEQERQERELQPAVIVPPVEFQAATSFSPYTGSMDAGDAAAASAAFSMAACMAATSAMVASMM